MKQPMIERLGLEKVPTQLKSTTWIEYFIIQLAFSVNAGNFLIPALAVLEGGLSFQAAFLATVLGASVAFLFVSFLSLPGSRYGLPAQYVLRSIIGTRLSMLIASPIRSLTSLYWFSVQTIGGTFVIISMVEKVTPNTIPFIPVAIGLAIIMTLLALIGFEAVKNATKLFIPILVIGQGIILYLFLTKGADSLTTLSQGQEPFSIGTFLFYSSLVFVQYISGVSASSDITRYSKSDRHGFWGLYGGNVVGFMMTALLGGLSASLFKDLNPFVAASQLTDSSLLLLVITACAMVSMISINLSNAYTGGYSLLNALPSLSRIQSALLFSIAGIILSSFPQLVYNAQDYISYLGILIIPISAIVVADYLVIRRGRISESALVRLTSGESKFNREALVVLGVGMVFYLVIPDGYSPGFSCFIITLILYRESKKWEKKDGQKTIQIF